MTRNGKIARLPRHIREQLNRRLEDGEEGETLLDWLNALPEAREILKNQFGGVPINKQSLSQWRLGGYQDWLARQEGCDFARELAEHAEDLDDSAAGRDVSDWLSPLLAVEMARVVKALLAEPADP